MDTFEIDFVRLEEHLNQLLYDPEIQKLQRGLSDYVMQKLQRGMKTWLEQFGLDAAAREEFLSAESVKTTRMFRVVRQNQAQLGLSGRMLREFQMTAKIDRESALVFLEETLLAKEQVKFRKEAGIPAKVWLNFLNCKNATGEATLEKIRQHLSLTPEEVLEFNSRIIRSVFPVDEPLRTEVHRLQKATGMTVSEFLTYAWISPDAWESFYPIRGEKEADSLQKEQRKTTSQGTLLKLVIGYGLDEEDAKSFMRTAHSVFAVRRDLVVLSGIRCGYQQPMQMQEILEFFAESRDGQRYYINLYSS